MPWAWQRAPSWSSGWITPISLLAAITLTSRVSGVMASCSCAGVISPSGPGASRVTLKPSPLQLLEGIEYGVMLAGHADQMRLAQGPGMAQERQIVGLGGTTGEHHPLRSDLQTSSASCRRASFTAADAAEPKPMLAAGGIAPFRTPEGRHRLHHLSRAGGGGLEIKGESGAAQDGSGSCCDHGAALRTALA